MQKLRIVSVPTALLAATTIAIIIATSVQAYSILTNVWPNSSTAYRIDGSINTHFGAVGVTRVQEAAEHWTNNTVFAFNRNDNSQNTVQAGPFIPDYAHLLGLMVPVEDGRGIYRQSYTIYINTTPPNTIWYTGVGTPPSDQTDLRTVLRHEFGHAAGLNHAVTGGESQLMFSTVAENVVKQIGSDDQHGIRYLYEANYNATHPDNTDEWQRAWPAQWNDYLGNLLIGFKGQNWAGGHPFPRAYQTTSAWSNGNNASGATSWLAFNGSRITWRFAKAYNRGWQDIYIDGVLRGSINSYDGSDILWQVQKTWDLSTGNHIIEVRGRGGGAQTDLDAFVVDVTRYTGTVDDASNSILFIGSGWTRGTGWQGPFNNTVSFGNTPDDAISFTFVGSGVRYYYTRAWNRGYAKITIDGNFVENLDLYGPRPNPGWRTERAYLNLGSGTHTIHIAVTGEKNTWGAEDHVIDVDQFVVVP